jgi:hypothetical protein
MVSSTGFRRRGKMTGRALGTLALATAALAGCSTVKISTDYDKTADFSKYTTFSIRPPKEIKSNLVQERIEDAITRQLTAKGLKLVTGSADLWVAYHVRLTSETQMDTTSFGYGWGPGWGYWGAYGYGGMGTTTTTVREVPVGTLIVDLVDAGEKKLVWQGVASDTLDPRATADDKDYRVNNAAEKMFARFPPKAK